MGERLKAWRNASDVGPSAAFLGPQALQDGVHLMRRSRLRSAQVLCPGIRWPRTSKDFLEASKRSFRGSVSAENA